MTAEIRQHDVIGSDTGIYAAAEDRSSGATCDATIRTHFGGRQGTRFRGPTSGARVWRGVEWHRSIRLTRSTRAHNVCWRPRSYPPMASLTISLLLTRAVKTGNTPTF